MQRWYASVNYGLEAIAGEFLRAHNAKHITVMDGALVFSRESAPNVRCVSNLFVIISSFQSKNIDEAARRISQAAFRFPRTDKKTFRVIVMDCGRLRPLDENLMRGVEKNITRRTGLAAHRANPEAEIWLNRRNDGTTYFMLRTEKRPSSGKALKKGELRRDIAEIMLYLSKSGRLGAIADPFGGWGAIAAAAAESDRNGKIFTGDIKDECVRFQTKRLSGFKNCVVQKWDAANLPLNDHSVASVVTDPPWGEYDKTDVQPLYDAFIKEAARILKPRGALVFLSSAREAACQSLKTYAFIYTHTPLKINGRETYLFNAHKDG